MSYQLSPYQGFGNPDVLTDFCQFEIRAVGGTYPDWDQPMLSSTRQIAGSSSFVTQIMGMGPSTITLQLRFANRDDYMSLRARLGTTSTLSLLARFTSHDGPVLHQLGIDYERHHDTMLLSITEPRHFHDGMVRCTAMFRRASAEVASW